MPVTPRRNQRDRRRQDPMNFNLGPNGCAVTATIQGGDTTKLDVEFNCNTEISGPPVINDQDGLSVLSVLQVNPRQYTFTMDGVNNAETWIEFASDTNISFGPNVTLCRSMLSKQNA